MITEIGQIAINVHDVERATAFYRDVLGLQFMFDAPGLAFFRCGSVRLMLAKPEKEEFDHPSSIVYYRVDNIQAASETLRSRGVEIEQGPSLVHKTQDQELWIAFFRDPDRNPVALMSELAVAPPSDAATSRVPGD